MELKDKVAMVTGASQGIGKVIAQHLAEQGAHVALVARSEGKLEAVKEGLPGDNHLVIIADLSIPGHATHAIKEAMYHYDKIDILINNAGSWDLIPFVEEYKLGQFNLRMQLNFNAPAEAMAAALEHMEKTSSGYIINISSMAAVKMYPKQAGYVASKIALNGLSASVAKEYEGKGIQVFSIAAGSIDTPMYRKTVGYNEMDEEEKAKYEREIKSSQDVADLISDILQNTNKYESPIVELHSYEFKG